MSYIVMSFLVLIISYGYDKIRRNDNYQKNIKFALLGIIILMLCIFAGLRTRYNDTYSYLVNYAKTPKQFSSLFSGEFTISQVYLFKIWGYVIYHYISPNVNVYFFLSSLVFVVPAVLMINKYSSNFFLSMLLFLFGGMYLFSLAGLKQAMATGVLLMSLPALFKKQYIRYYIVCCLALGFHAYSLFFFIVPILGTEKIFNKWTIFMCLGIIVLGIALSYFSPLIMRLIEVLGKDVGAEYLQEGSVNVIRAGVFVAPLVLLIFSAKRIDAEATAEVKILTKISILSTMFMLLSLFGNPILFGRIPQYFYIGIIITLPYVIEKTFFKSDARIVKVIAGILYIFFGLYSLYKDGAFAMDIFRLIIF